MNRSFFSFGARPHLQSKIIEVNVMAGDDPRPRIGNMRDVGTLYMELHEWKALRANLIEGMKKTPVGIEIHDGTLRKIK